MYLTKLYLPVLIYPPEWKEIVRVTCLAQEHNTMFPARAQGPTAQNREEIYKNQITGCLCIRVSSAVIMYKLEYMILKFILDNQLENARTALRYSYTRSS